MTVEGKRDFPTIPLKPDTVKSSGCGSVTADMGLLEKRLFSGNIA